LHQAIKALQVASKQEKTMRIEKDVTINAPAQKVFETWTDWENFPRFMKHVESVKPIGGDKYHWKAQIGPFTKEWDAEVMGFEPYRSVTWRATTGAENAGAITLSERGNITEMHVVISYDPNWFETLGDAVTKTVSRNVEEDLERFKRLVEGTDPDKADAEAGPHPGQHGTGDQTSITYDRPNV
jgi:uncharacterized membrane protein